MTIEKIERNGELFAVLPISVYEKLLEDAEMLEDIAAFDAAVERHEPAFSLDVWKEIDENSGFNLKKSLNRVRSKIKAKNKLSA